MMVRTAIASLILVATAATANATEYCDHSYASICDGCTATIHWYVTNAKVPRVRLGDGTMKSLWCTLSWRSLGGHNKITVITPPKQGQFKVGPYWVAYTSSRTGHDRVVTRDEWLGSRGNVMRATVIHEIDVVDHPL